MRLGWSSLAVFCVALICGPAGARAENRALLIGASAYPSQIGALRGPANDVEAVWGLLTERGFQKSNVRVLADSLPEAFAADASAKCSASLAGAGCPVHSNIVQALDALVATSRKGDYVIVFFSGHGVQVPDLVKRDEPDGLNEAFVPLDVGHWDPKTQTVSNLLVDDIVGDTIEKIRAKGAFVWAIFDTCHAGDMVRGATNYAVPRLIRGGILGIPDAAYVQATKAKPASRKGSSLNLLKNGRAGGLVGYYAAQSDQLALELSFEERDASGKPTPLIMGAFTNALRRALALDPNATYRQLAQRMVEIYSGLGADMPAPYFEGDLDKAIFSDKAVEPTWKASWQRNRLSVVAGELNGIGEGAILALRDAAAAGAPGNVVGYARVERVTANRSEAAPIEYNNIKVAPISGDMRLLAKLERPGIRAVLRVALPPAGDGANMAGDKSGRAAIDALRSLAPEKRALSIEWLETGQPSDMYLRLRNKRIWLLTPFGNWVTAGPRQSPSIPVAETAATANALQDNLWRTARALNLQRVAGSYRQSTRGVESTVVKSLNIDLYLFRDPRATPTQSSCPDAPTVQSALPTSAVRISADAQPEFKHCDIVYVVMRNKGSLPIDVTLLYVEAEAQINCFNGWGKARIDPGEVRERMQAFRIVTANPQSGTPLPIGRERLMVIGVEKRSRDEIETTFCHLQQKSLDSARAERGATRGSDGAFAALMEDAGLATQQTRGFTAVRSEDLSNVVMRTFAWDVKDGARK